MPSLASRVPHSRNLADEPSACADIGGAAGVVFMPAVATTAPALLEIFRVQAIISGVLFLLMSTWLWIPPMGGPDSLAKDGAEDSAAGASLTLREELRSARDCLLASRRCRAVLLTRMPRCVAGCARAARRVCRWPPSGC